MTEINPGFTDSPSSFPLNNGLLLSPQILPSSMEEAIDHSVLDFSPEEPPIGKGEGQTLPLESTAAVVVECPTTPPSHTVSQQESITTQLLPSEGSSNRERSGMYEGIEGIQPMVVDVIGEGMVVANDTTTTTCVESCSSTTAAVGSDFEHHQKYQQLTVLLSSSQEEQQQHSPLSSPSKTQTIPLPSLLQPQPQVRIIIFVLWFPTLNI